MVVAPVLTEKFRTSRERVLESFDFVDALSGQGFIDFYPATANDSTGATTNALVIKEVASRTQLITDTLGDDGGVFVKVGDRDYDFTIGVATTMGGVGYGEVLLTLTGSGNGRAAYLITKIIKVSGSTETILATGQTQTLDTDVTENALMIFDMTTTNTNFSKGDIIRATVETWLKDTAGSAPSFSYYLDPAARLQFGVVTTAPSPDDGEKGSFKISLPFRITR